MPGGAPRQPARWWRRWSRGGLTGLCLWLAVWAAPPAAAEVVSARYGEPTTRYAHAVLGDAIEYGALEVTLADGRGLTLRLPEARVFEDLEPRLADLDQDGAPEVVTVEAHARQGARLAIWRLQDDTLSLLAATPYIGAPFRWLAPVGVADLDGDGAIEVAFVDRPHLAKTLRIWRFTDRSLVEIATLPGVSNHKIGEDFISGGLRDCGAGPEMILADGRWQNIVSVRLDGGMMAARPVAPFTGPDAFAPVMACAE